MSGEHRLRRGAGGGRIMERAFHPKCKQEGNQSANRRSKREERESAAEDLRRSATRGRVRVGGARILVVVRVTSRRRAGAWMPQSLSCRARCTRLGTAGWSSLGCRRTAGVS